MIRESHFADWTGLSTESLRILKAVRLKSHAVPQLAGSVWLHPNRPGDRDEFADRAPVLLECQPSIIVAPDWTNEARLPLLGWRALRWAKLHVQTDGRRRHVTIRTARRFGLPG